MARLIDVLLSFGNAGAAANARVLLDDRRREDWTVRSLARRVVPAGADERLAVSHTA
jgi:hypothetical protein